MTCAILMDARGNLKPVITPLMKHAMMLSVNNLTRDIACLTASFNFTVRYINRTVVLIFTNTKTVVYAAGRNAISVIRPYAKAHQEEMGVENTGDFRAGGIHMVVCKEEVTEKKNLYGVCRQDCLQDRNRQILQFHPQIHHGHPHQRLDQQQPLLQQLQGLHSRLQH